MKIIIHSNNVMRVFNFRFGKDNLTIPKNIKLIEFWEDGLLIRRVKL